LDYLYKHKLLYTLYYIVAMLSSSGAKL